MRMPSRQSRPPRSKFGSRPLEVNKIFASRLPHRVVEFSFEEPSFALCPICSLVAAQTWDWFDMALGDQFLEHVLHSVLGPDVTQVATNAVCNLFVGLKVFDYQHFWRVDPFVPHLDKNRVRSLGDHWVLKPKLTHCFERGIETL